MIQKINLKLLEKIAWSSLIVFALVGAALIYFWNSPFSMTVGHNDGYIKNFHVFLENGVYNSIAEGTTVVYYLVIKTIYSFTENINTSFFTINFIAQVLYILIGVNLLRKFKSESSLINFFVIALFLVKSFQIKAYSQSSNDYFLSIFVILIIQELFKEESRRKYWILGLLLAVGLSIRKSVILVIPLILANVFLDAINQNSDVSRKGFLSLDFIKKQLIFLSVFIVVLLILHYPSLKENSSLSFYKKSAPSQDYTWMTRNYLGLKRVFIEGLPFTSGSVWAYDWKDVEEYVNSNKGFYPLTFSDLLIGDPLFAFKVFAKNFFRNILWSVRFVGLVLFLPLLSIKQIFKHKAFILYFVYLAVISIVAFTVTEYRWFIGYDILLFLILMEALKKTNKLKILFVIVSILLVTLFNIRTVYNLINF